VHVTVSKEVQFDAGHRVPDHASKCRNPHGHRYRVVAHVGGVVQVAPGTSEDGMVVDFGVIKALLTDLIHDRWDHGFIVAYTDTVMKQALAAGDDWHVVVEDYVPTAENLAAHCATLLTAPLAERGLTLEAVEVWETPTSCARWDR